MSDIMEAVREAGYQKGIEDGKAEVNRKVAMKMIADGYTDKKIQLYTDFSMDEINCLKKNSGNMEL